jgi:polar amino acid transport system permease protein
MTHMPAQSSAPTATGAPRARAAVPWHRAWWFEALLFVVFAAGLLAFAVQGAQSMGYQWKWDQVPRYLVRVIDGEIIWGALTQGLFVTLDIAWQAGLLALVIGLVTAVLRLSGTVVGSALAWAYIEVVRNTPILVQMLIVYFIIAAILGIPRQGAGVLCLALYEGAFAAEIIRGAIVAVKRGQWEAGRSLGFSEFHLYRDIVLPQAVPLMLPPLGGVLVNLVKHSAIVSVIAVFDLTTQARNVVSDTFMAFEIWLTTAAMYLVVTITLSLGVSWLEHRYRRR